jgi:hypothetical protein
MPAMNTGISNFAGFDGNGIGWTILDTLQASGTFFEFNEWHNNQILMLKGTNKVRSA